MTVEEENIIHYLKWFWLNADFGPADSDVRYYMNRDYEQNTNKKVPVIYKQEE